jgi:hypothetical protein
MDPPDQARAQAREVESRPVLRVSDASARPYQRREPENSILHKIVREHLDTFLDEVRQHQDKGLPNYVENELREFMACGVLGRGFVRAVCTQCGRTLFVGFSCKKHACPRCNARRMYTGAAHLVDHVIPDVPVRQLVLSVPFELRLLLAARADAFTALTHLFIHQVFRCQRERAREAGLKNVLCGAVAAHHRGGNSMNLHPHIHALCPDGVFLRPEGQQRPEFRRLPAPSSGDLVDIAFNTHQRFLRWLDRHHLLRTESDDDLSNDLPERSALEACAQGALGLGGLITRRRRGGYQQQDDGDRELEGSANGHRVGEWCGYSLYAGEPIAEGNVNARERLLRYCLRPPLSLERLSIRPDGKIVYQVKATRHGKATERVMEPLQFMARLVALIAPPRHPLWRYFGVFAPHCASRASVVPGYPEAPGDTTEHAHPQQQEHEAQKVAEHESPQASGPDDSTAQASGHGGLDASDVAASTTRQPQAESVTVSATSAPGTDGEGEGEGRKDRPRFSARWRIDWATLLRRVWNIDALACPCGGRLRFVEVVTDKKRARQLLQKAGLAADSPPGPETSAPEGRQPAWGMPRARSPTFFDDVPPDWD